MTLDDLHAYLRTKPDSIEDFPFGPEPSVYKIEGKMFALVIPSQDGWRINLKSPPDEAIQLRDVFTSVIPGYHMNKRHWNTISFPGDVPEAELQRQIDVSFALVVKGLPKAARLRLETRYGREALYC